MNETASATGPGPTAGALDHADTRLVLAATVLQAHLALGPCRLLDDRTVARVHAILADWAEQLAGDDSAARLALPAMLAGQRALLQHAHALAVEHHLTERLAGERGLDAVLPPLVRAHRDSEAVIALIAAQARAHDALRRMHWPLRELPGDLRQIAGTVRDAALAETASAPRLDGTAAPARLALLEAALTGLGDRAPDALDIDAAGVALWLTALAMAAGVPREQVALATAEDDPLRLAWLLHRAGLDRAAVLRVLLAVRPDADPALAEPGAA